MLEVCERFSMRVSEYRALPPGERALYNQFTLLKLEEEAKKPYIKLGK
jgi:hypothetical protein